MPRTDSKRHGALLSEDRVYRYALWRDTGALGGEGTVLFVGLNPSTADEREDDPTIRRCVGFARDWGYARLAMANAYAYRATNPDELRDAPFPVGPDNDAWLRCLAGEANEVIAAWGGHAAMTATREAEVLTALTYNGSLSGIRCLGHSKGLCPLHPLYLPADTRRVPFAIRRAA